MNPFNSQTDLQNALNKTTFVEMFDDDNNGFVETGNPAVTLVLQRAHAEVMSYMARIYGVMPVEPPGNAPMLLKSAELDYAVALSYERHPEYVRTFGEEKRAERWARGEKKMAQISLALQVIAPTDNPPEPQPRNVGGIVTNSGPRMTVDGIDGISRSGDF